MSEECQAGDTALIVKVKKSLPPQENYYQLLGVPVLTATTAAINSAYQKLAEYYHPDNIVVAFPELVSCGRDEQEQVLDMVSEFLLTLAEAKEVLLDDARRQQYDYDTFIR